MGVNFHLEYKEYQEHSTALNYLENSNRKLISETVTVLNPIKLYPLSKMNIQSLVYTSCRRGR